MFENISGRMKERKVWRNIFTLVIALVYANPPRISTRVVSRFTLQIRRRSCFGRVAPNDAKVVPLIKLPRQLSPGSETPPRCFVVLLRGHRRCNDCNARKEFVSNKRSSSASIYPSSIFFRNRVTEMCELS